MQVFVDKFNKKLSWLTFLNQFMKTNLVVVVVRKWHSGVGRTRDGSGFGRSRGGSGVGRSKCSCSHYMLDLTMSDFVVAVVKSVASFV